MWCRLVGALVWVACVAAAAGLVLVLYEGPAPSGGAPFGRPPLLVWEPPPPPMARGSLRRGLRRASAGGSLRYAGRACFARPLCQSARAHSRPCGRPARRGARSWLCAALVALWPAWWLCGALPGAGPPPAPLVALLGALGAPGGSVVLSVRPVGAGPSPCPPPRSSAPGVGVPPVWRLVALRGGSLVASCLGPPRGLCPSGLLSCWWAVQTARSGRGPRSPATGALLPSQDIRGLEMVKGKPLRGPQSGPLTISNPLMQDKSQQAKQ